MNSTTLLHQKRKRLQVIKLLIWAWLIDVLLWTYFALTSYKIIFQKIIMNYRFSSFSWDQPLFALIIGTSIGSLLFFIPRFSVGKASTGLYKRKEDSSFFKTPYVVFTFVLIMLTFVSGLFITQFSLREFLSPGGIQGAKRIFLALFTPNFKILEPALFAAIETIYMAFIATALAVPISFVFSFVSARNLMNHSKISFLIYTLSRFVMNLTRAIEPLIWAIIFSVWVGIGPFAGMLALFLHSIAALTKLYSEQVENIDDGPVEAIKATGAHPLQVVWYGIVPQVVLPFLSFTIYRWDINVRMATVIGLVGGGGIGTLIMQYQGLAKWNEVGLLVIVIASIVWVMDYASAKIRAKIK